MSAEILTPPVEAAKTAEQINAPVIGAVNLPSAPGAVQPPPAPAARPQAARIPPKKVVSVGGDKPLPAGWFSVRGEKGLIDDVKKIVEGHPALPEHWKAAMRGELAGTKSKAVELHVHRMEAVDAAGRVVRSVHFTLVDIF